MPRPKARPTPPEGDGVARPMLMRTLIERRMPRNERRARNYRLIKNASVRTEFRVTGRMRHLRWLAGAPFAVLGFGLAAAADDAILTGFPAPDAPARVLIVDTPAEAPGIRLFPDASGAHRARHRRGRPPVRTPELNARWFHGVRHDFASIWTASAMWALFCHLCCLRLRA
jgi:hypothetical protein